MAETKKVKSTGRFGSRYGVGIRKRVLKIEKKQRLQHTCPACGFRRIKRVAPGIYNCKKCNLRFSGGAYLPTTMGGTVVNKMVAQRKFLPHLKELIEAKQPVEEEKPKEKAPKEQAEKKKKEQSEKSAKKEPEKKKPAEKKQGKKPTKKKEKKKPAKKAKR